MRLFLSNSISDSISLSVLTNDYQLLCVQCDVGSMEYGPWARDCTARNFIVKNY